MTLLQSFRAAGRGLIAVWREERSFQIQTAAALLAFIAMFLFPLRRHEKIVVVMLVTWVLLLEILNSVVERFVDMVKPRLHFEAKVVKDMMAGAVLLMSFAALCLGLYIFLPYISVFVLQYTP